MTGYVRKDTTNNIADGNVINAADLDSEFDGVQAAFNSSTGHTHDGSSAEGAPITKLGPVQDVTISTTVLGVKTTNTVDLGTSSLKFKDFYLAGNASIGGTLTYGGVTLSNAVTGTGSMVLSASPTITGTITAAAANFSGAVAFNGTTTIGDADTDTITQAASYVTGTQLKSAKTATNTLSLAAYDVDGTAYTNLITLTASNTPTLALTSTGVGSMDNIAIGATTAATGAFTTLSASGAVTLSGGTANGVAYLNGSKVVTTGSALTYSGGFLGIDTASPSGRLSLGNAGSTNIGSQLLLYDAGSAANTNNYGFAMNASTGEFNASAGTSGYFRWYTANRTETMNLTSTSLYTASGINVGIGTSSPGQKLHVNGNIRVEGATSEIFMATGAERTISASGSSASTTLTFKRWNGSAYVDDVVMNGSGNLGIGTSSIPSGFKLYASGGNMLMDNNYFFRQKDTLGNNTLIFGLDSSNILSIGSGQHSGGMTITTGNSNITFTTNSAERMRIDSSGNLGVGTTPNGWQTSGALQGKSFGISSLLGVDQTGFSTGCYQDTYGLDTGWKSKGAYRPSLYAQTGSHLWFISSAVPTGAGQAITFTQAMTLDSSGNLAIGDTTANGRLAVKRSTDGTIAYFDGTTTQFRIDVSSSTINLNAQNGTGVMAFQTNGSERARIDSSGNLGIAQTDPTNNGISGYTNLVIGNSTTTTAGITIRTINTGTPAPGIVFARGTGGANGKVYYDQSTDRLYCQAGGSGGVYLASAGTSWTSASDERVKDIIEPIENATQKLANWRTVIGKYKSDTDGVRRSFLIAQDVLTTFPEAVNTDKAEEYGLNYQDLIPLLVASIQELKAEFDAYKASHP